MEITEKQRQEISTWLDTGSLNFFGRPFAGKDSQGSIFVELFGGTLFGAGDIFRNSVVPEHVKAALDHGEIVPTPDFVKIVLPYLSQKHLADQPLMLSGVGRLHGEEEGVIEALKQSHHDLKYAIYIDLPEAEVEKRWEKHEKLQDRGNRSDDSLEILEKRFKEFTEKTLPVIEFYRQRNLLIEVDGNQLREEVTKDILNQLLSKINA